MSVEIRENEGMTYDEIDEKYWDGVFSKEDKWVEKRIYDFQIGALLYENEKLKKENEHLKEGLIEFSDLNSRMLDTMFKDLANRMSEGQKELQGMKRCGNCHYCIKHYHGGLFCHLNQMDTSHNESPCKDWVLEKGKCES